MTDDPDPTATVVAHSELSDGDAESPVDLDRWRALANAALATEGVLTGELNLVFMGEDAMAQLNRDHMDGDGPTDVLAFPIDGEIDVVDDGVPRLLGDVIVCPAVARRNATSHGVGVDDEVALLVVHGILHVLGHDHAEPAETERMKERERVLLAAHHRP